MEARKLIEILSTAERLKDTMRHCYTSKGRRESVAEHSWMISLMALLIADEFPDADINKIVKMCLIHDLGECFTGDIPAFDKKQEDTNQEETLLSEWVATLPRPFAQEWQALYDEMNERVSLEAKIFKALDGMEALIQHNLSDISTWNEKEKEFNLYYADDKVTFSDYFKALREEIHEDTKKKLAE